MISSGKSSNKIFDVKLIEALDFTKLEPKSYKYTDSFLNVIYENNLRAIINFNAFDLNNTEYFSSYLEKNCHQSNSINILFNCMKLNRINLGNPFSLVYNKNGIVFSENQQYTLYVF